MVMVQRDNVVLEIKEDAVDRYLAMGYNVIDSKGNVIKKTIPNDVKTLQKEYKEHLDKIKELENKVVELQEQISRASMEQKKRISKN